MFVNVCGAGVTCVTEVPGSGRSQAREALLQVHS